MKFFAEGFPLATTEHSIATEVSAEKVSRTAYKRLIINMELDFSSSANKTPHKFGLPEQALVGIQLESLFKFCLYFTRLGEQCSPGPTALREEEQRYKRSSP